jgi:hypothetical protein
MSSFGSTYSDREVAAVANSLRRFGAKPSRISAEEVAKLRQAQ